jgi:hypothetical protein
MKRILLIIASLVVLAGCPGDVDTPSDSSGTEKDSAWGAGDTQQWYPDTTQPTTDTFWPTGDAYAGTPFGCEQDSDCFDLKCCPTPWGVKLCAATCSPAR